MTNWAAITLQVGLPSQLDAYPDATLAEHCKIWETTQGVQVSSATMSRAIQRLNWTRKKKTLRGSRALPYSFQATTTTEFKSATVVFLPDYPNIHLHIHVQSFTHSRFS
jgi:hypothetical protein